VPGYPGSEPVGYPAPGPIASGYPDPSQPAYPPAGQSLAYPPVQPPYGQPQPAFYPPAGPPPKKKNRTWLIVLIAVLVVLLAAAGLVYVLVFRHQPGDQPTVAASQDPGPVEAVTGFLQAVAQGQADQALTYLAHTPTNTTFLTNDALAPVAGQMTVGDVTEPNWVAGETTATVTGEFGINGAAESVQYSLTSTSNGWRLSASALPTVILSDYVSPGTGVTLNGIAVSDADLKAGVPLFPGPYQLALTNPFLALATGAFTVTDQADFSTMSRYDNVTLAADAPAQLASAAQAKLDACLASQEMMPTDCGFGFSSLENGATPNLSTLHFTLQSSDLSSATWQLAPGSSLQATATVSISIQGDVNDTSGNQYRGTDALQSVTVDFKDPANPNVVFR